MAGQETVDLRAAVAALAERGHRRMLAEGGPHLLAQMAAAGLLDELCLTIGPLLAGARADRIVAWRPATREGTAAAHPGPRPGGQRLPVLPVHQKRSFIPNGTWYLPPGTRKRKIVLTQSGAWSAAGCD